MAHWLRCAVDLVLKKKKSVGPLGVNHAFIVLYGIKQWQQSKIHALGPPKSWKIIKMWFRGTRFRPGTAE